MDQDFSRDEESSEYSEDSESDSETELRDYNDLYSEMELDEPRLNKTAASEDAVTNTIISPYAAITATYATVYPGFPTFLSNWNCLNRNVISLSHHRWLPPSAQVSPEHFPPVLGEDYLHAHSQEMFQADKMSVICLKQKLEFLFGDIEGVAIFMKRNSGSSRYFRNPPRITYHDIAWCLESGLIATERLEKLVANLDSPIYRTLLLLDRASTVYKCLPDATVSVEILSRPFMSIQRGKLALDITNTENAKKEFYETWVSGIPRCTAMGIVAYFECCYDIDRSVLENVMAISAGDSIYVPKRVLITK